VLTENALVGQTLPVLEVTYENAENHLRKKCRKWQITQYTKMPKPENSFTQKCRK
jgi:hypothetical protein